MSEQWYCDRCGPELAVKAYNECAVCCECDRLCIRLPVWLIAMQARIATLEKDSLEKVCVWILSLGGISTGHADTIEDLFGEVGPQIKGMQEVVVKYNQLREENKWLRSVIAETDEKVIPKLEASIAALERVAEVVIDVLAPDGIPDYELSLVVRVIRKPIIKALRAAGYLGGGE